MKNKRRYYFLQPYVRLKSQKKIYEADMLQLFFAQTQDLKTIKNNYIYDV